MGLASPTQASELKPFDHEHGLWSKVLTNIVIIQEAESRVDYQTLKGKRQGFDHYLQSLAKLDEKQFESFSEAQQLAFLINTYNARQLQLVLDNYPIDSVKDLGFLLYTPWKKEFFKLFGKKASLDHVEHERIRKRFNEPRIHFAVNCASIGCPPLASEAYTASKLEQQLEQATYSFLNNKKLNHYQPDKGILTLSPIFKWYAEDFGNEAQLFNFVGKYMEDFPASSSPKSIQYSHYDWDLNDSKKGF
jgi:hypothetical protein